MSYPAYPPGTDARAMDRSVGDEPTFDEVCEMDIADLMTLHGLKALWSGSELFDSFWERMTPDTQSAIRESLRLFARDGMCRG